MDFEIAAMTTYAESLGIGVDHPCELYRCGGSVLVATHGHLPGFEDAALALPADYFLHGHTHRVRDQRLGVTRVCNPGALHRARPLTVGILDCAADAFETITIG